MAKVIPGRYTAQIDGPFVVFIIGFRVNRFFAFKKWLPVFNAMPRMLRELYTHPEKGFLGGQVMLYWPGVTTIQYWRSFEALEKFARDPNDPHLPA